MFLFVIIILSFWISYKFNIKFTGNTKTSLSVKTGSYIMKNNVTTDGSAYDF